MQNNNSKYTNLQAITMSKMSYLNIGTLEKNRSTFGARQSFVLEKKQEYLCDCENCLKYDFTLCMNEDSVSRTFEEPEHFVL